ncbi:MAG: protein kinase [Planctomycetes bacterium]|nr:protein kinase [Planctomycetota bacterium]
MPKLKSISGDQVGKEYPIGAKPLIVGRRPGNAIVVDHNKVSRSHAEIGISGNSSYVKDLQSSNGTFLNGIKIPANEPRVLQPGDEIRFGDTILRYFDSDTTLPQVTIPGHEIIDIIAEGGMGTIYRAKQTSMDRDVAIKILHPEYAKRQEFVNRFIQEARSAGKLNHPNIIQVHTVGKADGDIYYFTMELVRGQNLTQRLGNKDDLTLDKILDAGMKVADALEYAHAMDIIHRDIKPDNIVISDAGEVKLADLGIAKTREITEDNAKKRVLGTPHYMSPEQATGKTVDARSDLYSLGATLYHVIAGTPLFDSPKSSEIMAMQVRKLPKKLKELAPETPDVACEIIEKLLDKDPAKRYQTAAEVSNALEEAIKTIRKATKSKEPASLKKTKPRAPATTAARKPTVETGKSISSTARANMNQIVITGFVALAIIIAAVIMLSPGSGMPETGGTGATSTSNPAGPTYTASQVRGFAENLSPAEARDKLEAVIENTRNPEISRIAAETLHEVNQKIKEEREKTELETARKEAWDDYELTKRVSPDAYSSLKNKLSAIQTTYPTLAERAAGELASIEKAESAAFDTLKRSVDSSLNTNNLDAALEEISNFQAKYPAHPRNGELGTLRTSVSTAGQKEIAAVKTDVDKFIADKQYGSAISRIGEFRKRIKYSGGAGELATMERSINSEATKVFNTTRQEVVAKLKEYDFPEATNALQRSKITLLGTKSADSADELEKTINGLARLHAAAINSINSSKPWKVPEEFGIKNLTGKSIAKASRTDITVQVGYASTKVKWTDLSKDDVVKIYKRYIPATDTTSLSFVQKYMSTF